MYLKGAEVSTNGHGLRGPSTTVEKPAQKRRVAVMGRSISMGVGVRNSEVFTSRLQDLLDASYPGQYEVINFSVAGYQLSQVLESYNRYVEPFDVDLILLPETPGGILAKTNTRPRKLPTKPIHWTNLRRYVQHFFIYRAALVTWLQTIGKTSYYDWLSRTRAGSRSGDDSVPALKLIDKFARERCHEGVPVVVVLLNIGDRNSSVINEKIRRRLEGASGLRMMETGESIEGGYTGPSSIYYGENHPGPAAHERYARAMFEWLADQGDGLFGEMSCHER